MERDAVEWLEKAYQVHARDLLELKYDPHFNNSHSDPRFIDLVRRIGLGARLGLIMAITALAMNVGMSTFTNLSLQAFLWLWLGLAAACAKTADSVCRSMR